jgi:hypothetical protein
MDAATVLETLAARGAVVTLRGDVLRIEPRAVIDEPLRAEIRAHKSELLELLTVPASKPAASTCSGFSVGAAYNPTEARKFAHELFQRGAVDARQRDQLLVYAEEANR